MPRIKMTEGKKYAESKFAKSRVGWTSRISEISNRFSKK